MHRRARAACPGVFEPTIEHSTLRAPVTVNQIEALVVTGCSHGREQVKGAGAPCFRRACAAPLGGCCASGRGLVSADLQATLVDKNLFPLGPPSSPPAGPCAAVKSSLASPRLHCCEHIPSRADSFERAIGPQHQPQVSPLVGAQGGPRSPGAARRAGGVSQIATLAPGATQSSASQPDSERSLLPPPPPPAAACRCRLPTTLLPLPPSLCSHGGGGQVAAAHDAGVHGAGQLHARHRHCTVCSRDGAGAGRRACVLLGAGRLRGQAFLDALGSAASMPCLLCGSC